MSWGQSLGLPFTLYFSPVQTPVWPLHPLSWSNWFWDTVISVACSHLPAGSPARPPTQLESILQREARVWFQYTCGPGSPIPGPQTGAGLSPVRKGRRSRRWVSEWRFIHVDSCSHGSWYHLSFTCQIRGSPGLSEGHKPYYEVCMQETWVVHTLREPCWKHPASTSWSMEKWPPMKLVPGAKKVGDRCIRPQHCLVIKSPLAYIVCVLSCFCCVWLFVTQQT